jgi:hypothetical protein
MGYLLVGCHSSNMNGEHLNKITNRLSTLNLVPHSLAQKINLTCQNKRSELERDLTREEYFTILRNETFEVLPEVLKQDESALNELVQTLQNLKLENTSDVPMDQKGYWALPLPNAFGSVWMNFDEKAMAENKNQVQALIKLLKEEGLIDENEYLQISQEVTKRSFLFQHQLYDLILANLRNKTNPEKSH